jgi:phosphohistidine phosphatase
MGRQLWVLRHAEAEPHGTRSDSERRLTDRGRGQARAAGVALARLDVQIEAVAFSPKARARETAEIVVAQWGEQDRDLLRCHEPLASGFDAGQALELARTLSADARLLLIGHEPDLSSVVADLTGGRVDLKKGGLAVVRLEGVGGELAALMRPRELALIAGIPVDGH